MPECRSAARRRCGCDRCAVSLFRMQGCWRSRRCRWSMRSRGSPRRRRCFRHAHARTRSQPNATARTHAHTEDALMPHMHEGIAAPICSSICRAAGCGHSTVAKSAPLQRKRARTACHVAHAWRFVAVARRRAATVSRRRAHSARGAARARGGDRRAACARDAHGGRGGGRARVCAQARGAADGAGMAAAHADPCGNRRAAGAVPRARCVDAARGRGRHSAD